ncbi:MAG: hypothetical protein LBP35_02740 [Candidatus Ancillula trichonymphae]|nr:hypothetical protein [Candidatus Ancillula trichonymphae]
MNASEKDKKTDGKIFTQFLPNKEILLEVKLNSLLIIWNGCPLRLRGDSDHKNAYQITLVKGLEMYLKKLLKYNAKYESEKRKREK